MSLLFEKTVVSIFFRICVFFVDRSGLVFGKEIHHSPEGFSHRRKVSRFPYGAEWYLGISELSGFQCGFLNEGNGILPRFHEYFQYFQEIHEELVFWSCKFWKTS